LIHSRHKRKSSAIVDGASWSVEPKGRNQKRKQVFNLLLIQRLLSVCLLIKQLVTGIFVSFFFGRVATREQVLWRKVPVAPFVPWILVHHFTFQIVLCCSFVRIVAAQFNSPAHRWFAWSTQIVSLFRSVHVFAQIDDRIISRRLQEVLSCHRFNPPSSRSFFVFTLGDLMNRSSLAHQHVDGPHVQLKRRLRPARQFPLVDCITSVDRFRNQTIISDVNPFLSLSLSLDFFLFQTLASSAF
jgi:hypothetical protein